MNEYKVGDMIVDPDFDELHEIRKNYEAEWIDIGLLKIVARRKENRNEKDN